MLILKSSTDFEPSNYICQIYNKKDFFRLFGIVLPAINYTLITWYKYRSNMFPKDKVVHKESVVTYPYT